MSPRHGLWQVAWKKSPLILNLGTGQRSFCKHRFTITRKALLIIIYVCAFMESKYVRQSAGGDVSFCRMTFYFDRDKREVGLPLILLLLQCCLFIGWDTLQLISVSTSDTSLFLCSGRKRYKKKSHTIIIASEAFVTHPNWQTPGYRSIYVQNLNVQKSRLHLCAGEPTKPWIMSQEYHSFIFLGLCVKYNWQQHKTDTTHSVLHSLSS
jgi:hypothetical protein